MQQRIQPKYIILSALLALVILFAGLMAGLSITNVHAAGPMNQAFDQASQEYAVPTDILKALCYMEGHLSNHRGSPSIDGGYGCMHLVENHNADTLDQAAKDTGLSTQQLKMSIAMNIYGGASVLRDYALKLSSTHSLPPALADWYGAVAAYSVATTRSTALMYADAIYKLLNSGFSAQAEDGEIITLVPQVIRPNTATATFVTASSTNTFPEGCSNDGNVDYPGAIDCILKPVSVYNCNLVPSNAPCNYDGAQRSPNRPNNCVQPTFIACKVTDVVIHDIEGTVQDALNVFQNPNNFVSDHYIVDSDGTIYQVVREKDIAFHAGNLWYNEHSIGIEHAGFDATGFQWYNAVEYLASAKLTAYLLMKYNIPLDHTHIVSHGTVPAPALTYAPNHVDPGPYWLWDYYLELIHQQGVSFPMSGFNKRVITLHPNTDKQPFGRNGTETPANFNFFYLYNGPSTVSGLIPQEGDGTDITDVTDNVEPDMSYYYLAKVKDPAGTGDTMYEIWYGEEDHAHDSTNPTLFADAKLAWLAVPSNAATEGQGTILALTGLNGGLPQISGRPTTGSLYFIGDAPNGATFISASSVVEDGTSNLWYEINYNHRQGWVPASEVTIIHALN